MEHMKVYKLRIKTHQKKRKKMQEAITTLMCKWKWKLKHCHWKMIAKNKKNMKILEHINKMKKWSKAWVCQLQWGREEKQKAYK